MLISFINQFAPGSSSEVLITSADSRIRVVDGVDLVHKFKGKYDVQHMFYSYSFIFIIFTCYSINDTYTLKLVILDPLKEV